jgi:hypothetical protein
MSDSGPTLTTVFGLDKGEPGERRVTGVEATRAVRELKEKLGADTPATLWNVVQDQVGEALGTALAIPLSSIFAGAWNRYQPLWEYCDPVRHPPEESNQVPLAPHTVTSTHHPFIEIVLGEKAICTLEFEVELSVKLEGAVVTIRDGKFREMATGEAGVEAMLSCEGSKLIEREIGEYHLPGKISFGEGIPIRPDLVSVGSA